MNNYRDLAILSNQISFEREDDSGSCQFLSRVNTGCTGILWSSKIMHRLWLPTTTRARIDRRFMGLALRLAAVQKATGPSRTRAIAGPRNLEPWPFIDFF